MKLNPIRYPGSILFFFGFLFLGISQANAIDFIPHLISQSENSPQIVLAADLDNDGDSDVISASFSSSCIRWWENLGGNPVAWATHEIAAAPGITSVTTVDINQDGWLDILCSSLSSPNLFWLENWEEEPITWWPHTIVDNEGGFNSVAAADMDSDKDLDIVAVSTANNAIYEYVQYFAEGISWNKGIISNLFPGASSVLIADLDADGKNEVLVASKNNILINVFKYITGDVSHWDSNIVNPFAMGVNSIFVADLDDDGLADVLAALETIDTIIWSRNLGGLEFNEPKNITTSADGAASVFAVDLDEDGLIDALSASKNDNEIVWHQNQGGSPVSWLPHVITNCANGANSVFAADLNGDNRIDILSAAPNDNTIAWYENEPSFSTPTPVPTVTFALTPTPSSTPSVTPIVIATQSPLKANNQVVYTDLNQSVNIQLNIQNDTGNPVSQYYITRDPSHGHVADFNSKNGTLQYIPNSNYIGRDWLEFIAVVGTQSSNIGIIDIVIQPIPTPTATVTATASTEKTLTPISTATYTPVTPPIPPQTPTPTPSYTPTASPSPTFTSTPKPTSTPTAIPTFSPTPTNTPRPGNHLPVISILPSNSFTVLLGTPLTLSAIVTDSDADQIQISLSPNAPARNINTSSLLGLNLADFQLDTTQIGDYAFFVYAYDGSGTAKKEVDLTVIKEYPTATPTMSAEELAYRIFTKYPYLNHVQPPDTLSGPTPTLKLSIKKPFQIFQDLPPSDLPTPPSDYPFSVLTPTRTATPTPTPERNKN